MNSTMNFIHLYIECRNFKLFATRLCLPSQIEAHDNDMLIVKIFDFVNPNNYFQSTLGSTGS